MDSIEIFVTLMDDVEVNKSLKKFNESTRSTSTVLKKSKLMKILRNQTYQTRVRGKPKRKMNPFEFLVFQQKDEQFEDIDEKEFFIMLNDAKLKDYPDHKKFANALIYFPEKTKQLLPKIEENIKNNRKPFEDLVHFNNQEELESYIAQVSIFSGEKWQENIEAYLSPFFDDKDKEKIEAIKDDVATWSLKELYEQVNNTKNEIPLYIYQYTYLLTHEDVNDSIKHCFIEEIMAALLQTFHKKINSLKDNEELLEKYSLISKEFETAKQQLSILDTENKELMKQLKQKEKEIRNIKIASEKVYKQELAKYDKTLTVIKNENEQLKEKLNQIQLYIKYIFPQNQDGTYEFAIVHSIETRLATIIYPEVLFIHVEEWPEKFETLPKDISRIYMVREGLTNRQIRTIKKDVEGKSIKIQMIFAGNEKDLIECVAILKKEQGGSLNV
ncbi:MAG: hypothetical protein WBI88_10425 [Caldicoprobacterales bacterium]